MAWLILTQLDGQVRSFSLRDARLLWGTELPGGPILHCGERRSTDTECRLWEGYRSVSACSECSTTLNCRCDDVQKFGPNTQQTEFIPLFAEESRCITCSLVLSPQDNATWSTHPPMWCFHIDFSAISSSHNDETVGIPVDELIRLWDVHSCRSHKAVKILRSDTLQITLDFFEGKVLSCFSTLNVLSGVESDLPGESGDSLRLVIRRRLIQQDVIFPPQDVPSSLENGSFSDERMSRTWYAFYSNLEFAFDGLSPNNELPCEPELDAVCHSFYIDQVPTAEGMKAYLHSFCDVEGFRGSELEISSPIASAYLVWVDRFTDTAIGTSCRPNMRCYQIPVRVSPDFPRKTIYLQCGKRQEEVNHKVEEVLSGVLDTHTRVLVLASNELNNVLESSHKISYSNAHEKVDGHSHSTEEDTKLGEVETMSQPDTLHPGGAWESSLNSEPAERTMVLCKDVPTKQNRTTDTNGLISPRIGSSFFDENFEVQSFLGRGASGAVLLARHRVTSVFYAVKVMVARDYFTESSILREVRLHAHLQSKYLVRYFACWSETITPFRVMQLARVGLCSEREVKEICGKATLSHMSFLNLQYQTSPKIGESVGWMSSPLPLLKAPPTTTTTVVWPTKGHNLLLGPPPQERNGITCLSGDENFDDTSTRSCSHGEDRNMEEESSEVSSSDNSTTGKYHSQVVFLQLEYCQTTLAHHLESRSGIDRLGNIVIALQLFSGLRYIHKCGCLHRDVKPTNIFLDYRSQKGIIDDLSDDDAGETSGDGNSMEEREKAVGRNVCMREGELSEGKHLPDLFVPSPSAHDFLRQNIRAGLLSSYSVLSKDTKCKGQREKVLHSIRVWLKKRLVQVRIGDFGIAKPLCDQKVELAALFENLTINTVGIGSPIYSSPEQLKGDICTPAADAFSAGVVFAEMYIRPKTISERLFELKRVREGNFPDPHELKMYPELQVVQGLVHRDPINRMNLRDASRILVKEADRLLLSFFQSNEY